MNKLESVTVITVRCIVAESVICSEILNNVFVLYHLFLDQEYTPDSAKFRSLRFWTLHLLKIETKVIVNNTYFTSNSD